MKENEELFQVLKESGILEHYDQATGSFTEAWDITTVTNAYEELRTFLKTRDEAAPTDIQIRIEPTDENQSQSWESGFVTDFRKAQKFNANLVGTDTTFIDPNQFLKLNTLLERPDSHTVKTWNGVLIPKLMPLIVQRLKMWGMDFIDPFNLSQIIGTAKASTRNDDTVNMKQRSSKRGMNFDLNFNDNKKITQAANTGNPLSRLDILTSLFSSCDRFVFQDILNVMSKFPISLPLIIQDLTKEKRA